MHLDETLYAALSEFVSLNSHENGIQQRFKKIQEYVGI